MEDPRRDGEQERTTPTSGEHAARPGVRVGERYERERSIGEGAFSITYRARDVRLGRVVALKILRAGFAADRTFVARFEREARVAASVAHPNVVDVYDYGADDGTFFIAMQYVPGQNLKQVLVTDGPLPWQEAIRIVRQILRGLTAIHDAGIIHRDIKPQNVLLGRDGIARVTDFGVAQAREDGSLTRQGTTVGTASYMAPEQARGGLLSEATDLYAVGAVLFELLTGHPPFEASNPMAVMLAHIQKAPPAPGEVAPWAKVPPEVDALVLRALAKDPSERFATAIAMDGALAGILGDRGADQATAHVSAVGDEATQIGPAVAASRFSPLGRQTPAAPPGSRPRAQSAPPPPPLPLRLRRDRPWLAPVVLLGLALVALAGVLAANMGGLAGGGGGDGGSDAPTRPVAVTGDGKPTARSISLVIPTRAPTPAPTAVPATTTVPAPTATGAGPVSSTATRPPPTVTAPPTETRTPVPPTSTAPPPTTTPMPTSPPAPTRTPPPAAPTSEPAAPVVEDDSATNPPIQPAGGSTAEDTGSDSGTGAGGTGSSTVSFAAQNWDGGSFNGDGAYYGRPWVALYGGESGANSASLSFTLAEAPTEDPTFSVTGLDDEMMAEDTALRIEVNGVAVFEDASPFPNWNGTGYGDGVDANWQTLTTDIPAGVFEAGRNTITFTNLSPTGAENMPPFVLLSDASIAVPGGIAVANADGGNAEAATEDPPPAIVDEDNGNSGSGGGG